MPRERNKDGALGRIVNQIGTLTHNLEDMHRFTALSSSEPTQLKDEIECALEALRSLGNTIVASRTLKAA